MAYLIWDPHPALFNFRLPLLDRPILWYGVFFALGVLVAYRIFLHFLRRYSRQKPEFCQGNRLTELAERWTFYVLIGAVIGARLGDVLFYQRFSEWWADPLSIIAVWKGGLASHGGAIGILVALWIFAKRQKIPFLTALDWTVIPVAAAALFIRIGNFFNQEILGTPSTLPWAIIFLHPADGGAIVPRHPAQLYEALGYLCVLVILWRYWVKHPPCPPVGKVTGWFLVLVFGLRFFVEFVKVEQSVYFSAASPLTMGQVLSIPFVALGCFLVARRSAHRSTL